MQVNRFVSVKNDKLIFGVGQYTVGNDIPAGEYYFCGEHIWFTVISQGERRYSEFTNDAYATVKSGDSLTVKNGNFASVDNIVYMYTSNELLRPNHIYRVGTEIPCGTYLFRFEKELFSGEISFCAEDDAAFKKFQQYPYDRYNQSSGHFGNVTVAENDKYVALKNGVAIYCEESFPDLYSLLSSVELPDNDYHHSGILAMATELYTIEVFQKDCRDYIYHGDTDAIISEQYLYAINGRKFWAGFLNVISFKPYHWAEFTIESLETGKQYKFGSKHLKLKSISDLSNSSKDGSVRLYNLHHKDFFEIRLPDEIHLDSVRIKSVRPDSSKKFLQLITTDLASQYSSELQSLAILLEQYQNFGIPIDIEEELKSFERAPDFIRECSKFLKGCLKTKALYDGKAIDKAKRITFKVAATYDKVFYCVAKLSDNAYDVKTSDNDTRYWITFSGDQIEEISLMLSALSTPYNTEREDLAAAREHLQTHDFFSYLTNAIDLFVGDLREKYGYSSFVTSSVLISINKAITKKRRKKLRDLYNEMAKENRITTRWSNEYKLFMIVSKLVKDAVYQYRADWLGQQSFDIFIPSQNIAIEYQGQQHYEAIDLFGGEEALEDNIKRDTRKRELSAEHGVKVLDWKYSLHVNLQNVVSFFTDHDVAYTISEEATAAVNDHIQMAPVQPEKEKPAHKKPPVERVSPFVIRQFDANGKFIAEYDSLQQAITASGVSEKSILNTVYGARKTGGGYIWRRCQRDSEVINAAPTKQLGNTGLAKKVLQFNKDGEFISEHASIGQAAKVTGVNRRSISDALSGVQKTAGGYVWRYADDG